MNGNFSLRGSEWHRWDPHLHAPGTLLNDRFQGDWEKYLKHIEESSPVIEALGVTDYFSIGTYREVCHRKLAGRLPNVAFIFPNVEMRLDIKTEKKAAINIHLLFSPDDPNHEREIERILGHLSFEYQGRSYKCTPTDLIGLGQKFSGGSVDERVALRNGANQFKVTLQNIRDLFRSERWLADNCLIAVAGSSYDGTAGLQKDDSYAATRQEIERFAHIIFASTPSQRDFWLGKMPGHDRDYIENTYRALKPCLHGSDAHSGEQVGTAALDRYCWLKGDLAYETLRQAVIEPEDRVSIGPVSPSQAMPSSAITDLTTSNAAWVAEPKLLLNSGMIAIIGARGSGKTALAEMIAKGAHAEGAGQGTSSFLARASEPVDYVADAKVYLTWADSSETDAHLHPQIDDDVPPFAKYLSQHFVERLCSAAGVASELRKEMERVVFETIDPTDRLQADSFDELLEIHLEPLHIRRSELRESIQSISSEIVKEDMLKDRVPAMRTERDALKKQIEQGRKDLSRLLPKGKQERAKRLAELEQACTVMQTKVEVLRRKRRAVSDLESEVKHLRNTREPARMLEMRRRFVDAELSDVEWKAFQMTFVGNPDSVIAGAAARIDSAIKIAIEGQGTVDKQKVPLHEWPLNLLLAERDAVKKEVGLDAEKQKKYDGLQRSVSEAESSLKKLEAQIKHAEGADSRRQGLIAARRDAYRGVFEIVVEEEGVLRKLYAPLADVLKTAEGSLKKLAFVVNRNVDLSAWCAAGEALLDLRKESRFRGQGALEKCASAYLLDAWRRGNAADVAQAMDRFRSDYTRDLLDARPSTVADEDKKEWNQTLAAWLYDTSHIAIKYGIEYEGVAIEQLSPGTRGIVLLLLYLVIDRRDTGPLIIDQPEENLDPRSVFDELVPHFREVRKRRQVIIVTHNSNLVVNTDVDQVIVATATRESSSALPKISYAGGSLENPEIRRLVCRILEGGERAFLERERRYRLHWTWESASA